MRPRGRPHRQSNMAAAAASTSLQPLLSPDVMSPISVPNSSKRALRYGLFGALVICVLLASLRLHSYPRRHPFADQRTQSTSKVNQTHLNGAKQPKAAFVVLTDPREDHFTNVIPMLAQVESKYGERVVLQLRIAYYHSGWTHRDYFIFIDGSLPSEEVQNATSIATQNKSRWLLLSEEHGWGKPDW